MMRSVVTSLFILLVAGTVCAQTPPSVVSARTLLATNAVHAGMVVKIAVVAQVQPGYHINDHKPSLDYLIPTKVMFDETPSLKVEKIVYPRGRLRKFVFLDSPISVYEGQLRLGAVLKVAHSVKPGSYPLRGKLTYQACNDHACLPPTDVQLRVLVRVVPSTVPLKPNHSETFKKISFN